MSVYFLQNIYNNNIYCCVYYNLPIYLAGVLDTRAAACHAPSSSSTRRRITRYTRMYLPDVTDHNRSTYTVYTYHDIYIPTRYFIIIIIVFIFLLFIIIVIIMHGSVDVRTAVPVGGCPGVKTKAAATIGSECIL